MKNAIKVFLVLYITLFISYSCQHDETLTLDPDKNKSMVNFNGSTSSLESQDSIQHLNSQGDSGELVSRRVFHNDICAGDFFVGFE